MKLRHLFLQISLNVVWRNLQTLLGMQFRFLQLKQLSNHSHQFFHILHCHRNGFLTLLRKSLLRFELAQRSLY
jgi:hypothetical protein